MLQVVPWLLESTCSRVLQSRSCPPVFFPWPGMLPQQSCLSRGVTVLFPRIRTSGGRRSFLRQRALEAAVVSQRGNSGDPGVYLNCLGLGSSSSLPLLFSPSISYPSIP